MCQRTGCLLWQRVRINMCLKQTESCQEMCDHINWNRSHCQADHGATSLHCSPLKLFENGNYIVKFAQVDKG